MKRVATLVVVGGGLVALAPVIQNQLMSPALATALITAGLLTIATGIIWEVVRPRIQVWMDDEIVQAMAMSNGRGTTVVEATKRQGEQIDRLTIAVEKLVKGQAKTQERLASVESLLKLIIEGKIR